MITANRQSRPWAVRIQSRNDRGERRRLESHRPVRQLVRAEPCVLTKVLRLVRQKLCRSNGWAVAGVSRQEERFLPDVASSVPDQIALDHAWLVDNRRRIEARLFNELPARGLVRGLARLDTAAGRLPELGTIVRITPANQQNPSRRVETHDPNGLPPRDLHTGRLAHHERSTAARRNASRTARGTVSRSSVSSHVNRTGRKPAATIRF